MVEFPKDEMEETRGKWEKVAMLTQSLGQRVPVDSVAKDSR